MDVRLCVCDAVGGRNSGCAALKKWRIKSTGSALVSNKRVRGFEFRDRHF